MTEMPIEGGTYLRDPATGALTRQPEDAPASAAAAVPTDHPPEPKPKGGK